jgi:hypothetical protein
VKGASAGEEDIDGDDAAGDAESARGTAGGSEAADDVEAEAEVAAAMLLLVLSALAAPLRDDLVCEKAR